MIKPTDITIAISTFGNRINDAYLLASEFRKHGFFVKIFHQNHSNLPTESPYLCNDIEVIKLDSIGVTKSRNKAIQDVDTDYIWFMDDDVEIIGKDISLFLSSLPTDFDLITLRIKNEFGKFRKKYPACGIIKSKKQLLSVGTIEIIAKLSFLKEKHVIFPENMGAGTELPVGDEAVFLSDVINKHGRIYHFNYSMLVHPDDSSGKKLAKNELLAKGKMLREVYGVLPAIIINFYFCIKLAKKSRLTSYSILRILMKGSFIKGKL